jgi:hypothetical protein
VACRNGVSAGILPEPAGYGQLLASLRQEVHKRIAFGATVGH